LWYNPKSVFPRRGAAFTIALIFLSFLAPERTGSFFCLQELLRYHKLNALEN